MPNRHARIDTTPSTAPHGLPPSRPNRGVSSGAMAIVAVCACAIGLGSGYQFGRNAGAQAEAAASSAWAASATDGLKEATRAQARLEAQLVETLSQKAREATLLRARHAIHQSIVHLHMRNFGSAEAAAHRAGRTLEQLTAREPSHLELTEQLTSLTIEVHPDIHEQVMWLADLAVELDASIDHTPAP